MTAELNVGDKLQYKKSHQGTYTGPAFGAVTSIVRTTYGIYGMSTFMLKLDGEQIERCYVLDTWEIYFDKLSENGDPVESVAVAVAEKPCLTCGKKCFITDKKCWWCESANPIGE